MIKSAILSQARTMANDTDTTNPFHSDAALHALLDNWQIALANELGAPRKHQSIAFTAAQGGASSAKALDADILTILRVILEDSTNNKYNRLKPSTEIQMTDRDPSWRNQAAGTPSYYVLMDAVTEAAAETCARTITTDRPLDAAKTMRIIAIQKPATGTDGTKSPVVPVEFHVTGVYYLAWHMYLPRSKGKADEFMALYKNEVRRIKGLSNEFNDNAMPVWDSVQAGGDGFTPDRLSI